MHEVQCCNARDINMNISTDLINEMSKSRDFWAITDFSQHFAYVNDTWFLWYDIIKKEFEPLGKSYYQVPSRTFDLCADKFKHHDTQVILDEKPVYSLEIHEWKYINGWRAEVCETKPFFDSENSIIGLISHSVMLGPHIIKKHHRLKERMKKPTMDGSLILGIPTGLSEKEFHTIFLILAGFSYKEIATIRKISEKTVHTLLNHIRLKHKVDNNEQLKDLAVIEGWYNYLPNTLFTQDASILSSKIL